MLTMSGLQFESLSPQLTLIGNSTIQIDTLLARSSKNESIKSIVDQSC
jgi:hypothetical protein